MDEMDKSIPGAEEVDDRTLKKILRKRTKDLAAPATDWKESLSASENMVVLRVGGEDYAIRLDDVEEIMRLPPITPVPCVPEHFRGIINRRGNILTIVDLKCFFTGKNARLGKESRIVIISREKMALGLLVDRADKIEAIPPENIKPPMRKGGGVQEEFCIGVITLGKRMVVLVDSYRLLMDDRMRVEKEI
jgi:purine-binding chemotaxis protein CheW